MTEPMTNSPTMDELREAMARAIIGPHNPVPENSPYTLEHLREVRWRQSTEAERKRAIWRATAALTAIREAGCAVVPREPSDVMIEKGADAFADEFGTAPFDRQDDMGSAVNIYRAMLAASEVTG